MFGLIRKSKVDHQINQLIADNNTLGQLVMHYKQKSDRLEQQLYHPRSNGKFSRVIPITKVEFKS